MDESYQALVRERMDSLQAEIRQILERVGDPHRPVRTIAVTKYIGVAAMADLVQAGIKTAGENRWQVAREKALAFPQVEWHFIGPLQRNKARHIARHFAWVHSVDRLELVEDLASHARDFGKTLDILLQVNISGEAQKSGVAPDAARALLESSMQLKGIAVKGLMGIAKNTSDESAWRDEFRLLRALRDELQAQTGLPLPELSMGMSEDYPVALEEGSTMLRIGRKLVLKEGLAH